MFTNNSKTVIRIVCTFYATFKLNKGVGKCWKAFQVDLKDLYILEDKKHHTYDGDR